MKDYRENKKRALTLTIKKKLQQLEQQTITH